MPYGCILLKSKSETDHVDGYVIWPYCMNMFICYIVGKFGGGGDLANLANRP